MFRCKKCGKVSKPREKSVRVVVETRPKDYFTVIGGVQVLLGSGSEIVKEITVCKDCNR